MKLTNAWQGIRRDDANPDLTDGMRQFRPQLPMTSGLAHSERYSLEDLSCGDLRLRISPNGRGELLARVLGGRFARYPRSYIFTPARAEKWRVLFLGGWAPRRKMSAGIKGWVFVRDGLALDLARAVRESFVS